MQHIHEQKNRHHHQPINPSIAQSAVYDSTFGVVWRLSLFCTNRIKSLAGFALSFVCHKNGHWQNKQATFSVPSDRSLIFLLQLQPTTFKKNHAAASKSSTFIDAYFFVEFAVVFTAA
jgi:hypothetical protein